MTHFNRARCPRLDNMLGYYGPYCEDDNLDSDAPAEAATSWWPDSGLAAWLAELDQVFPDLDARDPEEQNQYMGQQMALPAGNSYSTWLRYLREHIEAFYPHRNPQTMTLDGIVPPRSGRFTDKETANRAATEVLRANESAFRAWAAEHDGTYRLHLYADLGRPVGHFLLASDTASFAAPGTSSQFEPTRYEATGCVVLMRREYETGKPYIGTAYPEKDLPTEARERYPDLTLLLGGYFGQDYVSLDENRWAAERNVNSVTAQPVRERMADQLSRLLAEDDASVRDSVEQLGSYVLPGAIRRWVTGLHRRMTRLQW